MNIQVNDIELDVWEQGWPYWFHIRQGKHMISFTEETAPAISDALKHLVEHTMSKVREEERRQES